MKKLIFAANWKLNKNPQQTRSFFSDFCSVSSDLLAKVDPLQVRVLFFPPATNWEAASDSFLKNYQQAPLKEVVSWGAQNVYTETSGAFTGENSIQTLMDLGGNTSLVGHSERRQYFKEDNEFLNKKILSLQKHKITPVYCIGESLTERELGVTEKVLEEQIRKGLALVQDTNLILAYEPVWAIGTGKIATAEQVKETHAFIRKVLNSLALNTVPILYGGSVKADNATELIHIENVQGFLVGGASLEVKSFTQIIENGLK